MKPKLYRPNSFSIAIMLIGFGVVVFLKIRKNGLHVASWMDVAFYAFVPIAAALIANMCFARIWLTDDQVEIVGLLSRKRYPLGDITDVATEKGADVKFKLRSGQWISLPSWLGAEA
ncbi:MAG TPA: hypothetical protein VH518_17460 [Tepidisphaeraceae bacterium]